MFLNIVTRINNESLDQSRFVLRPPLRMVDQSFQVSHLTCQIGEDVRCIFEFIQGHIPMNDAHSISPDPLDLNLVRKSPFVLDHREKECTEPLEQSYSANSNQTTLFG